MRIRSTLTFVICCAFCAACSEDITTLTVPLQYAPSQTTSASLTLPPGQGKIYILPVEDQREDKVKIGENQQKAVAVPVISGVPGPADWVHDSLSDVLKGNGLTIVNSADEADLLLSVSLTTFWAKEDPNYEAQIVALVKVEDKTDKVLWSGTMSGTATYSGGSLKVEHYRQVLSDALYDAGNKLMANTSYEQALVPPSAGTETMPPPPH